MKDAGGLDRGGGSRSRKKWLQPLCTPRVKPADRWIGVGCTRRKKARNDSEGSGPGNQRDDDATYGGVGNCRRQEESGTDFGCIQMLTGCSSENIKSAVGKNARVQGEVLARIDI